MNYVFVMFDTKFPYIYYFMWMYTIINTIWLKYRYVWRLCNYYIARYATFIQFELRYDRHVGTLSLQMPSSVHWSVARPALTNPASQVTITRSPISYRNFTGLTRPWRGSPGNRHARLQNGVEWDHNPDSVHRMIGSPMRTNPSLHAYWTVLPTKCCPLSNNLPFSGDKGGGHSTALHWGTRTGLHSPSEPHCNLSGPSRRYPNGHKKEASPR